MRIDYNTLTLEEDSAGNETVAAQAATNILEEFRGGN
jgi:hypothetical protein